MPDFEKRFEAVSPNVASSNAKCNCNWKNIDKQKLQVQLSEFTSQRTQSIRIRFDPSIRQASDIFSPAITKCVNFN